MRHRTLAVRRRSANGRKERGFQRGRGKPLRTVSLSPLMRLCLLSPHSESKRPPRRRNLPKAIDYISPRAKIIADRLIIFMGCPHCFLTFARAEQAVGFIGLPSCRAGTYFRCTTKVGKGVQKREKTTVRGSFLLSLEPLIFRPIAVRLRRQGAGGLRLLRH